MANRASGKERMTGEQAAKQWDLAFKLATEGKLDEARAVRLFPSDRIALETMIVRLEEAKRRLAEQRANANGTKFKGETK